MRLNLNIYGSRFTFGLQGDGATPIGAEALITTTAERGFSGVEVPATLLRSLDQPTLATLRDLAAKRKLDLVVSTFGTQTEQLSADVRLAEAIGAEVMVTALENTLFGGDRRPHAGRWQELLAGVRERMSDVAKVAERAGVRIGIENHQDVDSRDLVWLCEQIGSVAVGVTFDTANGLGVAEHPVDFVQRIMPHVVYVHLKDYHVTWTSEGYQLLRCPVGEGIVPFAELVALLTKAGKLKRASVEIGALVPRVVRVFAADFWPEYKPRTAFEVARLFSLLAPSARPEAEAFRTPFEQGAEKSAIVAFEERELAASLMNAKNFFRS